MELKNCPFCGWPPEMREIQRKKGFIKRRAGHIYHYVKCNNCHSTSGVHETEALAATFWNRRARDD